MGSDLRNMDTELAKLEADQAQTTGVSRWTISRQIKKLLELRARRVIGEDILMATGAADPLLDEATNAREQLKRDIP